MSDPVMEFTYDWLTRCSGDRAVGTVLSNCFAGNLIDTCYVQHDWTGTFELRTFL